MRFRTSLAGWATALVGSLVVLFATPARAAPDATAGPALTLDVHRETLPNGLRVVLSVDHTSPTVAVDVTYDVGARNEERGRSGFAHLFEHMMFQGSRNVARGEHMKLVASHGGDDNATTNSDRTNYFEVLPSTQLALALWLEADRMKSLDVSQKNFENQRAVVKEELRMRIENAPYVPAFVRLQELIFQGYWPYEHLAAGNMKDLDGAELSWVRAFHDAYYGPNTAVLAVAGDFDAEQAISLIRRYFGDARPVSPPPYAPPPIAEQTAPRDDVVLDAHAKLPALMLGWAVPPTRHPDHYALDVAAHLLSDGESSRLYKLLVREKGLALGVDVSVSDHRGPSPFTIDAKLTNAAKVADVEHRILAELAQLARTGPTDDEMKKLRARFESSFIFDLQTNIARATRLSEFELFWGDARLVASELQRYLAVTKADVQRVVGTYLTAARTSRVEVKPADKEKK